MSRGQALWLTILGGCETKRDIWVSIFSLYYSTVVDIICDLLIMALPLRLLWNLQINRQQKTALAAIFSLGFIIIIFAIVRVIETSASIHHVDPVWLALWSMIEAGIGMTYSNVKYSLPADRWIASCCSLMPPIFSRPAQHALRPVNLRFQST